MDRRAVVAIGGNALILDGQRGTIAEQYDNARETARHIAALVARGWGIVALHTPIVTGVIDTTRDSTLPSASRVLKPPASNAWLMRSPPYS